MNSELQPGAEANPLLAEWDGPDGGVPPLDRIRAEHFGAAMADAIALHDAELTRIAEEPSAPTFANTLEALERSGRELSQVKLMTHLWRSSMSTPALQAVEGEIMSAQARHGDRLAQDRKLFERIDAVWKAVETFGLGSEQKRLTWHHRLDFVRAGAALGTEAKARLTTINQRIADLSTRFDQNVLADESEQYLLLASRDALAGMKKPDIDAAAGAAEQRGFPGKWLIANTRSAVEPLLTHADDAELRERAFRMFVSRGDSDGPRDNKPIVREIVALRAERAALLGYASHAAWAIEKTMARTPERAMELLTSVWEKACAGVARELEGMRALAREAGDDGTIQPWDYRYFAEKSRAQSLNLDWKQVEPYLQLDRLRDAMFWVANRLFGLAFEPTQVPLHRDDVSCYRVSRSGAHVGLFYFDPFARAGKKSGAWMSHYRRQEHLAGVAPIVSNNCNFLCPRMGEPALISWMDARTLFHEFGHALHGLLSDVTYPSLAGTQNSPDYVEFPSQVLESWLGTKEVLSRFALHHQTGEPMPASLMERVTQASTAGEAFNTVEQIASALIDQHVHAAPAGADPLQVERETLERYRCPKEIVQRHALTHFSHLFSGDQYAARYYSYLWADVLAADGWEAFEEVGDPFDPDTAARLHDHVLSKGNTVPAEEGYRAFRGRDPDVNALMRSRGFAK
jgi:peptidyl-dipeptidase Dcp